MNCPSKDLLVADITNAVEYHAQGRKFDQVFIWPVIRSTNYKQTWIVVQKDNVNIDNLTHNLVQVG